MYHRGYSNALMHSCLLLPRLHNEKRWLLWGLCSHLWRLCALLYEPPWTSQVLASAVSFAFIVELFSQISLANSVMVSSPTATTADHLSFLLSSLPSSPAAECLGFPLLLSVLLVLALLIHSSSGCITHACSIAACLLLTITKAGGGRVRPLAFA